MQMIAEKDSAGFDEIYNRYSSRLLSFLYRMNFGDEETAQDLLQDTFIRVINKAHAFDPGKKFSTWVYTIASNLCKNEKRRLFIKKTKHEEIFNQSEYYISENEDEKLDQKHLTALINSEINALKTESRKLLILRFQEDQSIRDIAGIMKLPEGTVKSRLHYIIKKLSSEFKRKDLLNYNLR